MWRAAVAAAAAAAAAAVSARVSFRARAARRASPWSPAEVEEEVGEERVVTPSRVVARASATRTWATLIIVQWVGEDQEEGDLEEEAGRDRQTLRGFAARVARCVPTPIPTSEGPEALDRDGTGCLTARWA